MSNDSFTFQYLQEKLDKGFPKPKYPDLINDDTYIYVSKQNSGHTVVQRTSQTPAAHNRSESGPIKVAMFFDGPFLPIRNGLCYTLMNLMRTLGEREDVDVTFVNCYRGWDNIKDYYNQSFNSVFLKPDDYFTDTGLLKQFMIERGIHIAQFFDTEVLTTIAPQLQEIGVRILLEVQNIDHVLLERLKLPQEDVDRARDVQVQALKAADFNLFRSEVDQKWGEQLGADPRTMNTYRGGICVNDFAFKERLQDNHRPVNLVFLGHIFYQPNENALHAIISQILPKLEDCKLTVIGITPPELISKYAANQNVTFLKGVEDLSATLLEHDIALAPLLEGSGTRLKLLDYLASGLPVVSTTIGAEGLDPEIHKYLTVEDDIEQYAKRITEIIADPAHFTARAKAGRAFVERAYDWKSCVGPFIDAYSYLRKN